MTLKTILTKRLEQLDHRKMMIPRYVENKAWSGKNHYSLDMIPGIEKDIEETKAAIKGIGSGRSSGEKRIKHETDKHSRE